MREKSYLKGTFLKFLTVVILFLCLLSAFSGIGDKKNQNLAWNQRNNNADDTSIESHRLVFSYELKPASRQPSEEFVDFYDISCAKTDNSNYNFNETKGFLEKYHCENLIPTYQAWIEPLGSFCRHMRYTDSIPNCSPELASLN